MPSLVTRVGAIIRGLAAEGGKVAFLFPGVDASFKPRVDDVAAYAQHRGARKRLAVPKLAPRSDTT